MVNKKYLILGANGFIGRNIVEYFSRQPNIELYGTYFQSKPFNQSNLKMLQADLRKQEDVDRVVKGKDVIIQAAAVTSGANDIIHNPHYHIADNAIMNSIIFRSAFEHSIPHVVFLSCSIMYHSSDNPLKETSFDANREIFPAYFGGGWNKVYFEKMCEFYSRLGRNKFTVLRHSNIYGPYDKFDLTKSHVFGATMTKVMTAKNGKIAVWGTGEEERDFLYISDLIHAIQLVIHRQSPAFNLYNVGYGSSISIKSLVNTIIKILGLNLSIEYNTTKPTIKTKLCLDYTKINKELGWKPSITLEEGILKTMKWYQKNFYEGKKENEHEN